MGHSRRRVLQIVAGSGVALTTGAAAIAPDPAFALIETHRKATALHSAALKEQERLEQEGVPDAGNVAEEACHADFRAWRALVVSPPHTLDGLRAWASYLDEVRMKEGWMLEDQAPAIVRTLARALKQCA